MEKKYKIYFIVLFLFIFAYLYNYRTTYKEYYNSDIIEDVKLNLKSNQELLVFQSKNPFNFYDIFNNLDKVSNQTVYGIITYPENKKNKYPLIIGVAGSLAWGEHHYKYLKEYRKNGIATLSLHSFASRGVKSTVGNQIRVTIPMVIHDAYMALNQLSNNNLINIDKIGITGWSLGGGVSLFAAWEPVRNIICPNYRFAAHLPFYPPCISKPETPNFSNSPIHILAGENDDWVPSKPCDDLINELNKFGYNNASITVYPNAHHSFDREMEPKIINDAYKLKECSLLLDDNGVVSTNTLIKIPMKNAFMQKIGLMFCAEKGPTMGGNKLARENALDFSIKFMKRHLIENKISN